jgi:8-oxo-dGTP diphosphatase
MLTTVAGDSRPPGRLTDWAGRAKTGAAVREWLVGGALIRSGSRILLVRNRRRNGSSDWSTPGGVIDEGESLLEGLTREVLEETGLVVKRWAEVAYAVETVAPGLGWHLRVEVHEADLVHGDVVVDDPDGIVEEARWAEPDEAIELLGSTPRWVSEPLLRRLRDPADCPTHFGYHIDGDQPGSIVVTPVTG